MPRHILLVGDDARRLQTPDTGSRSHHWTITAVDDGAQALRELARQPQDVLVTDLDAPAPCGNALLRAVSERWPSTYRIAIARRPQVPGEPAQWPVPVAHEYIFQAAAASALQEAGDLQAARDLHEAVERCLGLQDLLSHPGLRSLIGAIRNLPPRPRTFARLQVMMSHRQVTPKKICKVIESDAAITAKLLQLANCALFRNGQRITSIEQALVRLGFSGVRNLVMCAEVFCGLSQAADSGLDLDAMQAHVQTVARVTAALTAGSDCAEEAVLAAFLHDLGYWVLAQERPAQLDRAAALAATADIPLHEAERQVLGTSHAEVGAYLLGLWGMPNTLVEAVAYHHTPERVAVRRFNCLSALAVAVALSGTDDSDAFCSPPRRSGVVGQDFFEQLEGSPCDWVDAEKLAMACLAEPAH